MTSIRDPDRGEFTGAVQFGQHNSVAPIGLDPVAGLDRIRDGATTMHPCPSPLIKPVKTVAARSSLVTEAQLTAASRQSFNQALFKSTARSTTLDNMFADS
jgi:hypothetical protein